MGDAVRAAKEWLADDPDPDTRAELSALLDAGDTAALADRFDAPLAFGTAGLRGSLGAGPARMNRVVVQRAAAGLAAYLRTTVATGRVVIGYDARTKSDVFARDTADVLQGAGLDAALLPRPLPTPVLAYAIRQLGCVAGVMVTASHNPAQDNGYKVYAGDGRQIIAPVDEQISAEIARVGPVRDLPKSDRWELLGEDVVESYVERAVSVLDPSSARDLRIAYTPLHGVGRRTLLAVLDRAGFPPPVVVAEQAAPDPAFPTVTFPNPEEPGAADLVLAAAREHDVDLIVANDPDADRCAIGVPTPAGFTMLSGDDLGVLLAVHLLRRGATDGTFATTIVSSRLLARVAAAHGVAYAETLTGFKWLSRVSGLRYAYEEAIGYCADPAAVADKDGITAAALACELAATLAAEARSLTDLLDEIAREHGVHATDQVSVRVHEPRERDELLDRLHASPPGALGELGVEAVDDLGAGADGLPPTPGMRLRLAEDARVVVRPSGTEPKLKCYLEVVVPVDGGDVSTARSRARERLRAIAADLAPLLSVRATG